MSKIALVTGAGSGIGRASALALAADGWTVIGCGRRKDALDETAALGSGIESIVCDVADEAGVAQLFAIIKERQGRLDLVFNNAGTSVLFTNFGDLTYEQWRSVIDVNVNGAFLVASAAYRMMRDQQPQGGRIINNGSISSTMPRPGSAPYTASKHAISGLTRSIALDGREHNIACGQIDVGNAASDMTAAMAKGVPQADGSVKEEPVMDVSHVANAVTHMASLPPEANMLFVNVMATNMPFVGRG